MTFIYEVENPMVTAKEEEPKFIGYDVFNNKIYEGDEILVFDDDVYLKDELSSDAIKILKRLGCEERVAGED
jgi:hypothetical protein